MISLPKRTVVERFHIKEIVYFLLIIFLLMISSLTTGTVLSEFFNHDSLGQFAVLWQKMFHPAWSYWSYVVSPLLDTIRMALVGTLLGTIIAIPFALLSASNIVTVAWIRGVVRIICNLVRTLPDLLLAAVFTAILGFGPLAGVVTLLIFTFGQMAKLMFEAIETIDKGPLEALEAVGANKLQIIVFAVVPQIMNTFLSNFLYTFEVNVRASTVIGYVGAGGIGQLLQVTINQFRYDETAVIIFVILIVVVGIEFMNNYLREKLA
ncbi:phosphonate ABC transporter, permease protein PhnE [Oenococcus sicerae]|uniref:Phosphonate ABC transporter, permease protein PhnE n=1 Tax=Oenococcus sicerae TaxID=2203724 RepID=A0AAJ1RDW2_9LACO|nr:phosphonate ABC transporter, permease protein PhnE [Oenococcus sicerae]MDN6900116.1 phosphonate ABC transporter, permease protein PhnE [Oenococcus sicerae]QAS69725.1 phosphonate ABC transporter, permease protein PhnE [Oenococcus sicerae]